MGDRFKKVQAGQPLDVSATAWNAFIDAAQKAKNAQHDESADASAQFRQADIIKVRNDSGVDLPRFSVLGLSTPIFPPSVSLREFTNQVAMAGVVPLESTHFGRFAILLEPARAGRIARAWVSGVCQARVNVEDEDDTCADVTDGDPTKLTTTKRGAAQILWREGGLGEQWAIVRFGTICGTSVALERCDCPEDSYEVSVDCIPCAAYGRSMPKYWWLTVITSADSPYSSAVCTGTDCADIPALFKLTNEVDAYNASLCLWTGSYNCFDVELSQDDEYFYIKIWDKNGCLLVTLRKPVDEFDCCGINEGWEVVEGSVCIADVRLSPHECTCCQEGGCPPPGEQICPEWCCENHCFIDISAEIHCNAQTCPQAETQEQCEQFPGCQWVNGQCVPINPNGCSVSANVTMKWIGGCSWYGRESGPGYIREGSWGYNPETGKWAGWFRENGCFISGEADTWDCHSPISLTVTSASCDNPAQNGLGITPL